MSRPRTLLALVLLLFGVIFPLVPKSEANALPPTMKTWFLHASREPPSYSWFQLNLTMNENQPEIPSMDPEICGYNYFVGCIYFNSRLGTTYGFTLNPSYPFGLEIAAGTASLELWMRADLGDQGVDLFNGTAYGAEFGFNLTRESGQPLSAVAVVTIPPFSTGASGWNHTQLSIPIPETFSIPGAPPGNLTVSWLNPPTGSALWSSGGGITFAFNSQVHPSSLQVPANYFPSSLSLGTNLPGNGSPDYPSIVRLGETVRVRGTLTNLLNGSGISGALVTLTAHRTESFQSWQQHFVLANVLTSTTGDYEYDWSPLSADLLGDYGVVASWPGSRYFVGNMTQPYVAIDVVKASTGLTLGLIPTTYLGFAVEIHGSLTGLNGPIAGANVVLTFGVPGSDTWTTITSSQTNSTGIYQAIWIPQATGDFTLQARWAGDAIQDTGIATAFLTSIATQGASSIWVGSATLVSDLSFNSDTRMLSFNLSPPVVAGSTVTIYIPKRLSNLAPNAPLTLGGGLATYSVQEANAAWLVSFNVPEDSSSKLQVVLGPLATTATGSNASALNLLLLVGLPVATASAGAVMLLWRKRNRPSLRTSNPPP